MLTIVIHVLKDDAVVHDGQIVWIQPIYVLVNIIVILKISLLR